MFLGCGNLHFSSKSADIFASFRALSSKEISDLTRNTCSILTTCLSVIDGVTVQFCFINCFFSMSLVRTIISSTQIQRKLPQKEGCRQRTEGIRVLLRLRAEGKLICQIDTQYMYDNSRPTGAGVENCKKPCFRWMTRYRRKNCSLGNSLWYRSDNLSRNQFWNFRYQGRNPISCPWRGQNLFPGFGREALGLNSVLGQLLWRFGRRECDVHFDVRKVHPKLLEMSAIKILLKCWDAVWSWRVGE